MDSHEETNDLSWLNKAAIGLKYWPFVGWLTIYALVADFIHFSIINVPVDADSAYQVEVGRLIREYGILRAFPWTPFSWLSDHCADKELLFTHYSYLLPSPIGRLPQRSSVR